MKDERGRTERLLATPFIPHPSSLIPHLSSLILFLFMPQGLDRIHVGGPICRVHPKDNPHDNGDEK